MSKEVMNVEEENKDLMAMMSMEAGDEEHLSKDEVSIPLLKIAQKGSSQIDKDAPEYIDGLEAGNFFNVSTETVFGDSVNLQALVYYRNFVIWEGAKGQGQYKGTLSVEEFETMNKELKLVQDGGDYLHPKAGEEGKDLRYTDTRNYAVILPDYPEEGIMILALSSTGIKVSKNWNSKNGIRRYNGRSVKRYCTVWEATTGTHESKGFKYKQISAMKPLKWADMDELKNAKSFEEFAKSLKETGNVNYSEDHQTVEPEISDF